MLTRRRFALCAIIGAAAVPFGTVSGVLKPSPAHAASDLRYPEGEFVQIDVARFDSTQKQFHYTAYRISPRGAITAARYSDQRQLLAVTPDPVLSPLSYRKVLSAAQAGFRAPAPERGRTVRFRGWVSAARSTARRTSYRVLHDPAPQALSDLAEMFEGEIEMQRPQHKGVYVVTSPVEASGTRDLVIARQSSMAQAIVTSLSQEHLAVAVDNDREVARFLEGENLNRLVFAANFNSRVTHFCVVTAA